MNPATHRAQLVGMLAEAAEIEHCLMCSYLYAAFSLKQSADEDLLPDELDAVGRWRREIIAIGSDEMLHLALVNNLAISVGARPHYRRFNFPIAPGLFPADIAVELAPLDAATLDHFVYLERPADAAEHDDDRFVKPSYQRRGAAGRLMQIPEDYATVGELYEAIAASCVLISEHLGEAKLFIGPQDAQLGPRDFLLPGLRTIASCADAQAAVEFIRRQGEGSRGDVVHSHYARFVAIRDEWHALAARRPGFTPARAVARNPVMRMPADPTTRVHITAEPAASLLDAGNVCYEQMLRLLTALSDVTPHSANASSRRHAICNQTLALMHTMSDVGSLLGTLPASAAYPGVRAGLTFTASRTVLAFLSAETATLLMAERFACVADRFESLAAQLPVLGPQVEVMRRFSAYWTQEHDRQWPGVTSLPVEPGERNESPVQAKAEMSTPSSLSTTVQPGPHAATGGVPVGGAGVDEARGREVLLRFDTRRCIHARHCVLGEPTVFLANTPGEWLFPDTATPERIAIVAAQCPSGAITYERLDGGPNEAAPLVNVARVRENGPLAFHAELQVESPVEPAASGFRAVLCRCGASNSKPYCDGSHNKAGFKASGEAMTRESQPLAVRDGPLAIAPQRNGPLQVTGNLELCTGTGRTIDRLTQTWLCRCGHSGNKPFCDGTHRTVDFVADGL